MAADSEPIDRVFANDLASLCMLIGKGILREIDYIYIYALQDTANRHATIGRMGHVVIQISSQDPDRLVCHPEASASPLSLLQQDTLIDILEES